MGRKEIVFKTPWFEIESEEFDDLPSLGGKPMYRMNIPPSVIMLPFTEDGKLVCVRQFRPAPREYTLEVPCGYVDKGEAPEGAARRELFEETGYQCSEWHYVSKNPVLVDRIKGEVSIFMGKNAVQDPSFTKEDGIEVHTLSLDEVKKRAASGEISALWILGALTLTKLKLEPPELKDFV